MVERAQSISDREPVPAEDVLKELSSIQESIEESVLRYKDYPDFNQADADRILNLLNGKIKIFSEGLLPSDNYSGLHFTIDRWLGFAKSLSYKPKALHSAEDVLSRSLDAVQGNMISSQLLSDDAIAELRQRWPTEESSAD